MSKKVVLTLDLHDNKDKQKAMKAVSSLPGLESLAMNSKEKKLTVIGDVDPVELVAKLRKFWRTEIVTVGPAKEQGKNKDDTNKDSGKTELEKIAESWRQHYMNSNNNNYTYPYYTSQRIYSAEENPNSCVIC